ncbi:MAG: hypothetical protein HY774_04050 [Acidobacteria bacterium]|nr:hypothetical protein [Acidobacteriota bacterium]
MQPLHKRLSPDDLRSLTGQLLLIGGLFAGSVVLAAGIATQRTFFEKYRSETYQALPANLKPLVDSAVDGDFSVSEITQFQHLPQPDRLRLYDDWMLAANPSDLAPRLLTRLDAPLYLTRAERTLVCGNPDQQRRAVFFLEQSNHSEAIPILQKALNWAEQRHDTALVEQIQQALQPENTIGRAPIR